MCVYHFMQYSKVWESVWAGVSGASTSNFRSYHPLIVCLKEVFSSLVFSSSPYSSWLILPSFHSFTYCYCHPPFSSSYLLSCPCSPLSVTPASPTLPSSYPDNHRGPTRTRGRRQDSQSNRSSDQWALYIATVTPK